MGECNPSRIPVSFGDVQGNGEVDSVRLAAYKKRLRWPSEKGREPSEEWESGLMKLKFLVIG